MYTDPTGHSESNDIYIKDATTLALIDEYGRLWIQYNKEANEAKKAGNIDLYNELIAKRDYQHTLAEQARQNYAISDAQIQVLILLMMREMFKHVDGLVLTEKP